MAKRRIVFVGGGTGGHFYPLMGIVESILAHARTVGSEIPDMYYMGPEPYDIDALNKHGLAYIHCPSGKRRKYRSILNFLDFFKIIIGTISAIFKLFRLYPDVIMSKGGYTSVPVVTAAWLLRIPIVVHESDAVPGTANKLGAKFARYVAIAYADTAEFFPREKTVLTGIPIRGALLVAKSFEGVSSLGIDPTRHTILVLGGSMGAERINQLILESLDDLLPTYNIIHQTGKGTFDVTKNSAESLITDPALLAHYHPVPFLDPEVLNQAMHTAAVIISRAGSGTIHEIAVHAKPSVLIPIPEDISHDQRTNAYTYARTGAATVMEEENLRDGLLMAEINRIMGDQQMYTSIVTAASSFAIRDAAQKIAVVLTDITNEH